MSKPIDPVKLSKAREMFAERRPASEIMAATGMSRRTVKRWRAAWKEDQGIAPSRALAPARDGTAEIIEPSVVDPGSKPPVELEFWRREYLQAQADEDAARERGHGQVQGLMKAAKWKAYERWQELKAVVPDPEADMNDAELVAFITESIRAMTPDQFDQVVEVVEGRLQGFQVVGGQDA